MPTFGFSAYLKLVCLNSKPQLSEIRKRLDQEKKSGYDFHRSLRLLAHKLIVEGQTIETLSTEIGQIVKLPERTSAIAGLRALANWRRRNPGRILGFQNATYQSPDNVFGVTFSPNFGLEIDGKKTAIHVWNTKRPKLEDRFVYGALALFPRIYSQTDDRPDDLAVLSLRDERLYRLSDVGDRSEFGAAVASAIESLFKREGGGASLPPSSPSPDRPSPPPAP